MNKKLNIKKMQKINILGFSKNTYIINNKYIVNEYGIYEFYYENGIKFKPIVNKNIEKQLNVFIHYFYCYDLGENYLISILNNKKQKELKRKGVKYEK